MIKRPPLKGRPLNIAQSIYMDPELLSPGTPADCLFKREAEVSNFLRIVWAQVREP